MDDRANAFVEALKMIDSAESKKNLSFIAGQDGDNRIIVKDLTDLQHLLIAGASGSGKSTFAHEIVLSLIHNASPEDVRLILLDTKLAEYAGYSTAPHLLIPVVSNPQKTIGVLQWLRTETLRRLNIISQSGVRTFEKYNNEMRMSYGHVLPHIVVLIDDAADAIDSIGLMDDVIALAMNSRAAGIHLILVTQHPSDKRISEIVKSSIPSRVSFTLINDSDKRLLFGSAKGTFPTDIGEMIFVDAIEKKREQVYGFPVADDLIYTIVTNARQKYDKFAIAPIPTPNYLSVDPPLSEEGLNGDEMQPIALDVILETGQASVSMLQRRLKLGYARAARILDELEERGFIGPFQGSKPREILITKEQWAQSRTDWFAEKLAQTSTQKAPHVSSLQSDSTLESRHKSATAASQKEVALQAKPWRKRFKDWLKGKQSSCKEADNIFTSLESESVEITPGMEEDFLQLHPLIDDIHTKAVGVTYDNDDGTSRQEAISKCKDGEQVLFRFFRFRGAPAIAVHTKHGQIGFLSADLAEQIECDYGCNVILFGTITNVTGGGEQNYGCNIRLLLFRE